MRVKLITTGLILLGGIMFGHNAHAVPRDTTTPEREAARCRSEHRLCMDVAEIDYNSCMGLFNDFEKCFGEWGEDVSGCLDDLNDCADDTAAAAGLPLGQVLLPQGPLVVAPVSPSQETLPNPRRVGRTPLSLAPPTSR